MKAIYPWMVLALFSCGNVRQLEHHPDELVKEPEVDISRQIECYCPRTHGWETEDHDASAGDTGILGPQETLQELHEELPEEEHLLGTVTGTVRGTDE